MCSFLLPLFLCAGISIRSFVLPIRSPKIGANMSAVVPAIGAHSEPKPHRNLRRSRDEQDIRRPNHKISYPQKPQTRQLVHHRPRQRNAPGRQTDAEPVEQIPLRRRKAPAKASARHEHAYHRGYEHYCRRQRQSGKRTFKTRRHKKRKAACRKEGECG